VKVINWCDTIFIDGNSPPHEAGLCHEVMRIHQGEEPA
jgi:hypothetical protein